MDLNGRIALGFEINPPNVQVVGHNYYWFILQCVFHVGKAQPVTVSSETAKIWSLSADDVLDNDIVSPLFITRYCVVD